MKTIKKMAMICILLLGTSYFVQAQSPYSHGVGAYIGSFNGLTYKGFFAKNFAFQLDLGLKFNTPGRGYHAWGIELNPNLMYEKNTGVDGLYWFAGGGINFGFAWGTYNSEPMTFGKFGVNSIGGVEYKFKFPMALQADLRPGFGILFNRNETLSYFDWVLSFGIRYTIK